MSPGKPPAQEAEMDTGPCKDELKNPDFIIFQSLFQSEIHLAEH